MPLATPVKIAPSSGWPEAKQPAPIADIAKHTDEIMQIVEALVELVTRLFYCRISSIVKTELSWGGCWAKSTFWIFWSWLSIFNILINFILVHSAGFEPTTFAFGKQHSIQLSYECYFKENLFTHHLLAPLLQLLECSV